MRPRLTEKDVSLAIREPSLDAPADLAVRSVSALANQRQLECHADLEKMKSGQEVLAAWLADNAARMVSIISASSAVVGRRAAKFRFHVEYRSHRCKLRRCRSTDVPCFWRTAADRYTPVRRGARRCGLH